MGTEDTMTMQQAQEEMKHFRKIFHAVRLFDENGQLNNAEEDQDGQRGMSQQCYEMWKQGEHFDNCVVRQALNAQKQKSKLEILDGQVCQIIARYIRIDGKPYVMELLRRLDSSWAATEVDYTKLLDAFNQYNDKLYKDAVTDAYNRRYYEDELKDKIENAGVALLDVDDFKLFNDTYGHNVGDMALHKVVEIIRQNIRKSDQLVRFGGDEFLLVMPDIEEDIFIHKLQLIRHRIHDTCVPGYPNLKLSISTGGVLCSGETIEHAMNKADRLMYRAKIRKNMVVTEKDERNTTCKSEIVKQKILVIDDSELNRHLLRQVLEDDFDIIEAEDGGKGLQILKECGQDIALVMLDIIMPVMDGFEVLMHMNRNRWIDNIPVIMISTEDSGKYVRRAFKLGASDYISRPFDSKAVYQRAFNTIKLYAKQRRLMALVTDQMHEKERNNEMMIEVLSQIVEFRNEESGLHVVHINALTRLLLENLVIKTDQYHLTPADCYLISTASAFHDIGKIGIDQKILNKPGRLTPEEFEVIKTHTLIGASMLSRLDRYKNERMIKIAYEICRWHHERYDGKGYPDGLKGEDIPITAQVVSLADVYDALVSKRAYKDAFPHEKAMEMILNGECGTFNPLLLDNLVEVKDKIRREIYETA